MNGYFGPIEAEFILKDLKNMTVERHTAQRALVPAAGELRAITLHQRNSRNGYSYAWETKSVFGDPQAEHMPTQPYLLPIPPDKFFISLKHFSVQLRILSMFRASMLSISRCRSGPRFMLSVPVW